MVLRPATSTFPREGRGAPQVDRAQTPPLVINGPAREADQGGAWGSEMTISGSSAQLGLNMLGWTVPIQRHCDDWNWLCVTSIAGPNGAAQLYER